MFIIRDRKLQFNDIDIIFRGVSRVQFQILECVSKELTKNSLSARVELLEYLMNFTNQNGDDSSDED